MISSGYEALSLTWGGIDFLNLKLTVGKAKTAAGTGRVIPINADLAPILAAHREWFVERFGEPKPGWNQLRAASGVRCRLHDIRHTFATDLAENGTPESTMLELMGDMSRSMLQRYSHIRDAAKREAMSGVRLRREGKTQISEAVPVKVPVATATSTVQ